MRERFDARPWWRRGPERAARTRSACTCRRPATRSWATAGTAGEETSRPGSGSTRPFLHSWFIAFDHPVTGERVELEDPLPDDLERALTKLRRAG